MSSSRDSNAEHKQLIVFKQMSPKDAWDKLISLAQNRLNEKTFLIRESSEPGMLSITYNNPDKYCRNIRLQLLADLQWVQVDAKNPDASRMNFFTGSALRVNADCLNDIATAHSLYQFLRLKEFTLEDIVLPHRDDAAPTYSNYTLRGYDEAARTVVRPL